MKLNWKKNTAVFMSSQAVSQLGSSLVQFAITSYITVQTQSGIYAMMAIICATLPMFLLSPFAGVWADRYNRKTLIILADGAIAACTLIVAVLFLLGHESMLLLFIALIIRSFGSAVQAPCVGAMLPDIVPAENLNRVNGMNGSLQALFSLGSPILGALLLSHFPLGSIFFVDIITAILAITILLTTFKLPQKKIIKEAKDKDYFSDLEEGFRYIIKTRFLMEFFAFCIIYFILMAPAAFLTQVQVVRNYGEDYWYLSTIEVAFAVGMVVGSVGITLWGGLKNKIHTVALAAGLLGICSASLGIRMPFTPYVILMGGFGLAIPAINTPVMTLLQEKVETEYIGRVFGVMTMINTSMMPLGMVLFGPLADVISIEAILIGTGVLMTVSAWIMTRMKALCQIDT